MASQTSSPQNSKVLLISLVVAILFIASLNFTHTATTTSSSQDQKELQHLKRKLNEALQESKRKDAQSKRKDATIEALKEQLKSASLVPQQQPQLESVRQVDIPKLTLANQQQSEYQTKAASINSFWWPSLHSGLLGKLSQAQNPDNCETAKFFVWRSLIDYEGDTRGLTAWGHTFKSHLMHALTDGDGFHSYGSRILIEDGKLWPMAKGCEHGPETRECYFEPLTRCKLSDVDATNSTDRSKFYILNDFSEEYNRTVRTIYSTRKKWFRTTKDTYAWTGLPGGANYNSEIAMVAASFAYYFTPKPWLRQEIHERLQKSIAADLDPDQTIGVPIRRSDKCKGHQLEGSAGGETQCPSLNMYLDGVKRFIAFDSNIRNVIVTSEDKSACDDFIELLGKEAPDLRVVVNVGDVQQGTGSGSALEKYIEGATNSAVVASALTSMHLHMRARYFVITSKSTWTTTIVVMARVYGFATSDIFVIDVNPNQNALSLLAQTGCTPDRTLRRHERTHDRIS